MALGKRLKKKGHTVKFFGIPDCRLIVEGHIDVEEEYLEVLANLYPFGYTSMTYDRPEEMKSRTAQVIKILDGELDGPFPPENKPDILLAGYFIAMEALLLHYRHNIPLITTTTFLRHPAEDPAIFALRYFASLPQELASRFMKEAARGSKVAENLKLKVEDLDGTLESIRRFVAPLATQPELLFCPGVFDFDYFTHNDNVHYIEASILSEVNKSDSKDTTSNPYAVKTIYATAGSRVRDYLDGARNLFKTLIDMMSDTSMEEYHLKLVVGHSLEKEIIDYVKIKNTKKVTVIPWLEQTAELKNAHIAVTHGGLASIKECIYNEVPFVIVPMGKDQKENAVRVREANIGAVTDIDSINVSRMINVIADAQDVLKTDKLGLLSAVFKEEEKKEKGVKIVEEVLKGS